MTRHEYYGYSNEIMEIEDYDSNHHFYVDIRSEEIIPYDDGQGVYWLFANAGIAEECPYNERGELNSEYDLSSKED